VEEIVDGWTSELNILARAFGEKASCLRDWDVEVLRNRGALLALEAEGRRSLAAHASLERQLSLLETRQAEVNAALESIEAHAERMLRDDAAAASGWDAGARERDALYEESERVADRLVSVETGLRTAIEAWNAARSGGSGDSDGGAVASAERVLNHQLSALLWLDSKSRELAGRVEAALTTAR